MRVEPIGIYPIEAPEPCHLIELWLRDVNGEVNFSAFIQATPGQPSENWQAAYDEWLLSDDGTTGELAPVPGPVSAAGDLRVAFFFHYLDESRPLQSPCGTVYLPAASQLPTRLSFIEYGPPS